LNINYKRFAGMPVGWVEAVMHRCFLDRGNDTVKSAKRANSRTFKQYFSLYFNDVFLKFDFYNMR
jgi:hypothetical protein